MTPPTPALAAQTYVVTSKPEIASTQSSPDGPNDHAMPVPVQDDNNKNETKASGDKSSSYSNLFPFFSLPIELQVAVLREVPNLRTVVSLLQTSKAMNTMCKAHTIPTLIDRMVAPFYDHYGFLTNLHIPEKALIFPPLGGWPNLTYENCKEWGKAGLVIDVLRRLPYIESSTEWADNTTNIDYNCYVIDYSKYEPGKEYPGKWGDMIYHWRSYDPIDGESIKPETRIVFASGYESGAVVLAWDIMTGYVFPEIMKCWSESPLPLELFFDQQKRKLRSCQNMFVPGHEPLDLRGLSDEDAQYDSLKMDMRGEPSSPGQFFGDEGDIAWVRHLYLKHGWPGSTWSKEEGMRAIKEFLQRRTEE